MSYKKHYVCLDVECASNTDLVAIGLFVADDEFNVVVKEEYWIRYDYRDIKDCKGFWKDFKHVWDEGQSHAKSLEDQIKAFVDRWDNLAKSLGVTEDSLEYISDNPEFDFGRITPYVKMICGRDPIRYTLSRGYKSIDCLDDAMWALGVANKIMDVAKDIQPHDHFPSNDAHNNWLMHLITKRLLSALKLSFLRNVPVNISTELDVACKDVTSKLGKTMSKQFV